MKHSLGSLITALGAAIGTAQLAHAEVLIGVPAPITGPLTSVGDEIERGIRMVVTNLNQAGGVLGQEIRAIMVDDYCDPDQAVAAAELTTSYTARDQARARSLMEARLPC
jgi:branched-chain amino acid transport system substrate-binding protein